MFFKDKINQYFFYLFSCLEKVKIIHTRESKYLSLEMAPKGVADFHTLGGNVVEIFKPLGVSLGECLESRLSPCS